MGTLETQLMSWLYSYVGQGFLQGAMQLWSDTPQAEGVVDAMIIMSEEILEAWAFIMEKRAKAIKVFQLFQSLSHRVLDSEEFRHQVIFQDLSKDHAVAMMKQTLGKLGEAFDVFKEFMQFSPLRAVAERSELPDRPRQSGL